MNKVVGMCRRGLVAALALSFTVFLAPVARAEEGGTASVEAPAEASSQAFESGNMGSLQGDLQSGTSISATGAEGDQEKEPQVGEAYQADQSQPRAMAAASSRSVQEYIFGMVNYDWAKQVLTLVNQQRTAQGLPALTLDAGLTNAAMQRAAESSVTFEHKRPDGSPIDSVFPSANTYYGENLAVGQPSPSEVMKSWMNSQGHKENILDRNYTTIGIGVFSRDGIIYWSQLFGNASTGQATASGVHYSTFSMQVGLDNQKTRFDLSVGQYTAVRDGLRVSGSNRWQTMRSAAMQSMTTRMSGWAIVASGENFPDALAASSLAGALNAPIVLTEKNQLNDDSKFALQLAGAKDIIVVGGTASVSNNVVNQLKRMSGVTRVQRAWGNGRIGTANAVFASGQSGSVWSDTAIIATSGTYADALSVASYAYASRAPIFLVNARSGFDATTRSLIKSGKFKRALIIGGTASVSTTIGSELQSFGLSVRRISGSNRYQTSTRIADYATSSGVLHVNDAIFTSGENFPDALSAGTLGGRRRSVMLLVSNGSRDGVSWLQARKSSLYNVYIVGGVNSVSRSVEDAIASKVIR